MIVYRRLSWLRMFFVLRGSILGRIWARVLSATLFALGITLCFDFDLIPISLTFTVLPFQLIGTALAIFLGFRNNSSYDRYWEGRKLWGRMINTTRTLTRQILTLCQEDPARPLPHDPRYPSPHHEMVHLLIAYVHAVRHHLRDEPGFEDAARLLPERLFEAIRSDFNPPIALLHMLGQRFAHARTQGAVDPYLWPTLEQSLLEMTDIQGGCERIKKTPIPFSYTVLMHRIVGVYCFTLVFGLYSSIGDLTPVVVCLIAYSFFGLDAIGDEIEEPFGTEPNDLPLLSFCTMLEREARQRLGEDDLPKAPQPVDHVLI